MNYNREKSFSTFKKPLAISYAHAPTRLVNPHAPTRICCQLCYALYYKIIIKVYAFSLLLLSIPECQPANNHQSCTSHRVALLMSEYQWDLENLEYLLVAVANRELRLMDIDLCLSTQHAYLMFNVFVLCFPSLLYKAFKFHCLLEMHLD